jgi:heterodisulfide reductase subunit B
LATIAMMAANARDPFDQAIRCRLDRSRALMADLEQIWARERAELEELACSCASHPGKLAFRRALVMLKHWSRERQIHDELLRACGFVRPGG